MTLPTQQDHLHAVPASDPDQTTAELALLLAGEVAQGDSPEYEPEPSPGDAIGQLAAALYIDADNQSPQLSSSLLHALTESFAARIVNVTIAGNNSGKQVDCWRKHLSDSDPTLCMATLEVAPRKEAADIALILELGTHLEWHIREQHLVIVMSRDDLLIGAAEQAKARGARVLLAYADTTIPTAGNTELSTLLLPATTKPQPKPKPQKPPTAAPSAKPTSKISINVPTVDKDSVSSVLSGLRKMCPVQTGGGYSATHVGQALSKMSFDAKARKQFLKTVPNLGTRGSGPNKVLLF